MRGCTTEPYLVVVKEEITLDDHDRIATLQVNIRSAVEVSPSALDSNPAVSNN